MTDKKIEKETVEETVLHEDVNLEDDVNADYEFINDEDPEEFDSSTFDGRSLFLGGLAVISGTIAMSVYVKRKKIIDWIDKQNISRLESKGYIIAFPEEKSCCDESLETEENN